MMIKPASEAKDNLQTFKKTIKKREDKKLDYERYQSRVDTGLKKTKRSDRDNAALAKAEKELETATESYRAADDHIQHVLPPLLQAVYSLQPYILTAQIQIQNNLLGHYYTSLHTYCSQEGFPNPAPPMDEIIRIWDDSIRPVQKEAEAIAIIATGKTVRINNQQNGTTNGHRRTSQTSSFHRVASISPARAIAGPSTSAPQLQLTDVPSRPKITSANSTSLLNSHLMATPNDRDQHTLTSPSPSHSAYATPLAHAPAGPNADYFSRERQPSQTSTAMVISPGASAFAGLAGKKKPPPPPPRKPSEHFQFVTALYDFGGQGDGDLVFKEGDKIRVIKKTESTDDWWQGELRGVRGMFPANYCS